MEYLPAKPDKDYIVHGVKLPSRSRSSGQTKTELTDTTQNLSHRSLFSSGNLKKFAHNYAKTQSIHSDTWRKGVHFEDEVPQSHLCYSAPIVPAEEDRWFTRAPHLNKAAYPVDRLTGEPMRTMTPESKPAGMRGIYLLGEQLNSSRYPQCDKYVDVVKATDFDPVAGHYFPVTLGQTYDIRAQLSTTAPPPKTPTFSPPPTGLPLCPEEPWRPVTPHNKGELHQQWHSTNSLLEKDIRKNFVMSTPPPPMDFASVYVASPYQIELARLRMERLRLEEEIFLETKRQGELERTRGPKPKWYELKTPRFHYESHKNTELIRNSPYWQDLMDYRRELEGKSEEFSETFGAYREYDKQRYMA